MNFSYRELSLLLASTVFIISFVMKFIIFDVKLTYMPRDIILFFAIYMIAKNLFFMVDRILINFRKLM